MPADKFTKKADTPKLKRQWQHVEDSALSRGASAGEAIRMASGVIKKESGRGKKRGGRGRSSKR